MRRVGWGCQLPCLALALHLCETCHALSAGHAQARPRLRPGLSASGEEPDDPDDWLESLSAFDGAVVGARHVSVARAPPESLWCARSKHIVPSPEDLLDRRTGCSSEHVLRDGNPFGRFIRNARNDTFFYVVIPKTGCTSVKMMLQPYVDTASPIPRSESDVGGTWAFAFVRHPVLRFVSGYGTFIKRLGHRLNHHLKFLLTMPEPGRFNKFVELFVKHGSGILQWQKGRQCCVFHHLMSQTWFLNFWPGPVQLYHVDDFAEDVRKLCAYTGLNLTLPRRNVGEGSKLVDRDLLMKQKGSLRLLHEYFGSEMGRLGYGPLLS